MTFFMFLTLVSSRIADWRRSLFLLVDFLVRMWRLYALNLLILPVPVALKRFAAALLYRITPTGSGLPAARAYPRVFTFPPFRVRQVYLNCSSKTENRRLRVRRPPVHRGRFSAFQLKTWSWCVPRRGAPSRRPRSRPAGWRSRSGCGRCCSYAPSHGRGNGA